VKVAGQQGRYAVGHGLSPLGRPEANVDRPLMSAVQLISGLRNLAALVVGALELVRRRPSRAIAAGDGRGTVGGAASNLVKRHLPGMAVVEADYHHAEVQEIGDDRE